MFSPITALDCCIWSMRLKPRSIGSAFGSDLQHVLALALVDARGAEGDEAAAGPQQAHAARNDGPPIASRTMSSGGTADHQRSRV